MRTKLKKLNKKRLQITGIVVRFGTKANIDCPQKPTLLLKDIRNAQGKLVAGHVWVNYDTRYDRLNLKRGGTISFKATVKQYIKNYTGFKGKDYGLRRITNIRIANRYNNNQNKVEIP